MKRIHPGLWIMAALLAGMLAWELTGLRAGPDVIAPVRDRLHELRAAADSCQASIEGDAARFQAFDAHVDSLRERVRELEGRDRRGVPADSYAMYLEVFDEYNDSVDGWSNRADTVQTRWERCRMLTEAHNLLADSLREMLVRQLEENRRR